MSYVDRMCLRLMAPCLLPALCGALFAWGTESLLGLPRVAHGVSALDLPSYLIVAGGAASVALYAVQAGRLLRWRRGRGAVCYVCGCLLGGVGEGRWGRYRRCMGCGKQHPA
ncbi:hypothetical protein FHW84_003517 [Dyella sp. SG562]|uniref:hypothetical protein n=1 Tax=Dyella TaxID=231454 RepID=UPI0014210EB2|nr:MULTISPECIES: hypothetical protein [unclassified Dyella]NII74920.1 hypothetical protein [Dyella sp. SG562]NKJ20323.1 hypothetical protein [Dyella sp. SG609]